jgi:hypothetical protein
VINKIKADGEASSQGKKKKSKPNKEKHEGGDEVDDVEMTDTAPAKGKDGKEYPEYTEAYMIFVGPESARAQKATLKELNAIVPSIPQFLDWSEQMITWGQANHPAHIPRPGKWALVIDLIIDNYKFSKVLMDRGSNINILYLETLHRMKLSETQLEHSNVTFHGVIPGRKAQSLGNIALNVTFGTPNNF